MDSTIRIKAAVIIINGVLPAELNIKPSLALIKFVPGIVEVALRLSAIVLAFCVLVSASVTEDQNGIRYPEAGLRAIHFMIFLSLVIMLIENIILLARFLNISIINKYAVIAFAVDITFSTMMFIGLIISSSIALHAVDVHNLTTLKHTASSAFSAAAVLGVFLMVDVIALAIWMGIFSFKKWNNKIMKQINTDEEPVISDEF